jgi:hypothetical protein
MQAGKQKDVQKGEYSNIGTIGYLQYIRQTDKKDQ